MVIKLFYNMKKFTLGFLLLFIFSFSSKAQSGYDIKLNLKGCPDTSVYLVKYYWTSLLIVDSCKKIKNGKIQFKGKTDLDKGVYALVGQNKSSFYFQIFVNEGQKFTITGDLVDVVNTLKSEGSKENEIAFTY